MTEHGTVYEQELVDDEAMVIDPALREVVREYNRASVSFAGPWCWLSILHGDGPYEGYYALVGTDGSWKPLHTTEEGAVVLLRHYLSQLLQASDREPMRWPLLGVQ
jgi:hypothetical protein